MTDSGHIHPQTVSHKQSQMRALARARQVRTALFVKLAKDLANDLPNALQRFEVVFRLVVILLQLLHLLAH